VHSRGRRSALKHAAAAGLTLLVGACKPAPKDHIKGPDSPFAEGALRLDFRHSVREGADAFELARLRAEPKWGGRVDKLALAPDWGDYRVSLQDSSDTLLFRAGFDSSLDPAARAATASLSVRVPMPRRAVRAVIEKRRADRVFQMVWSAAVDPADRAVDRSAASIKPRVEPLLTSGPSASRVDLAMLGDGYAASEYSKFISDALRATGYIFSVEPYAQRRQRFNVWSVFAPGAASGVADPFLGVQKQSVFGSSYGTGAFERTLAVENTTALREAASAVPYDYLLVLVNSRRYGGSAHFGGPAAVAMHSAAAKYLVLHELAHAIAGLAEEYYIPSGDGPAYRGNIEPWHPNVTLSANSGKWKDASGAAARQLDWNKVQYEKEFSEYVRRYEALRSGRADEAAIEQLMAEERKRQAALLGGGGNPRRVGLFEGAHGYARGVFRCEVDCIMFSLQTDYFCAACTSALERAIDYHST
jgi:hypothetical protein